MKVSVCVPAFERPDTTRLLVESFLAQDHIDRELVITDDSRTEAVEGVIGAYSDSRVVYRHHHQPLGFAANLRAALERASGDVVVILGDDDLLARRDSLAIYAACFESDSRIGYACSNLVQIDGDGIVTFAYVTADQDVVYERGPDALDHLLLTSVHIAGIAFRRTPDLLDYYPRDVMLFPQVLLASRVLTAHSGLAIGAFLTAARMHEAQLGFTSMKTAGTPQFSHGDGHVAPAGDPARGQHGNVEVPQVIAGLRRDGTIEPASARSLEKKYVRNYATNFINEKVLLGNRIALANLRLLRANSEEARRANWLGPVCASVLVLPRSLALRAKLGLRGVIAPRLLGRYDPARDWPLVVALQLPESAGARLPTSGRDPALGLASAGASSGGGNGHELPGEAVGSWPNLTDGSLPKNSYDSARRPGGIGVANSRDFAAEARATVTERSGYQFNFRGYGAHQAIADMVVGKTTVLDVGCASGYLMEYLRRRKDCHCVGIEPHAPSASRASSLGFEVICATAEHALDAIDPSRTFNTIIFGDVLEHMVEPLAVLKRACALLKPDGAVVVSLPNVVSLHARVRLTCGIWRYEEMGIFDRTHLRFFTVRTGRELLSDAGLRIVQERYVGPLTFHGGRRFEAITRLRPQLLANGMVFLAQPAGVPTDAG